MQYRSVYEDVSTFSKCISNCDYSVQYAFDVNDMKTVQERSRRAVQ